MLACAGAVPPSLAFPGEITILPARRAWLKPSVAEITNLPMKPWHGAKWDRHQLGCQQPGTSVGGRGVGRVVVAHLFWQCGYANLPAQPILLFPRPSRLPSLSRGDVRPGVFNPVKPSLLITPGRASSLPAMPAAGWMLLLFLSDLLSRPQPRGISYSACAQPPSWTVNELLEQKELSSLTLKTCKLLPPTIPSNSNVPLKTLPSPYPFHPLILYQQKKSSPGWDCCCGADTTWRWRGHMYTAERNDDEGNSAGCLSVSTLPGR